MQITSFTKSLLFVISRPNCSRIRVRAAMQAATSRWPQARWVSSNKAIELHLPGGSVGLTIRWGRVV